MRFSFLKSELKAWLFLTPATLILLVFQIYPILSSFLMGFYAKFNYITGDVEELGFTNITAVLSDTNFAIAIRNTLILTIFAVPLGILLALLLAMILNNDIRLKRLFQTIYFLPFVTSLVAISIVWSWMLNREFGFVNALLGVFGVAKVSWLSDSRMTLPILIALSVWKGLGYKIIIFLAAFQAIDQRQYDAARIDGANLWRRFRYVTLPSIRPTVFFLSVTTVIATLKTFDEVYVMYHQQPGPLKSGLTIVYYIFNKFYHQWQFAQAAAAAFLLFLIVLVFTLVQWGFTRKRKEVSDEA